MAADIIEVEGAVLWTGGDDYIVPSARHLIYINDAEIIFGKVSHRSVYRLAMLFRFPSENEKPCWYSC